MKNNNTTQEENITQKLNIMLEKIRKKKGLEGECSITCDQGFSIDVRQGDVETLAFHEDNVVQVTIYKGHHKGSASTTDMSEASIEDIIQKAYDIASASQADPYFGLADKALMQTDHPHLDLYHPWDISPAQAIEHALHVESLALKADARIINSDGTHIGTYHVHHGYANTHGGFCILPSSHHTLSCSLVAQEGGGLMQRDYAYTTARHHHDLIAQETLAKRAVERTIGRLNPKQIKTQTCPVIFSNRISSELINTFIHAISGSNLYRKHSFLLDKIGHSVFPKWMHIHEKPHIKRGLGSSPIDGDGVPTRENTFVENGILQQYVLGTYSARRLGLQTTANAGGVHNLIVTPNMHSESNMIQEMDKGLFVTELMGQGVNILTGDYSRGAAGYWIEDGKIQYPVDGITIAGHLQDMFKGIVGIGDNVNPNFAAQVGSIWIDRMTIAGSES